MEIPGQEVERLYNEGLTQRQIATSLGCGITTVRRRMKKLGLVGRSKGARSYELNEGLFDVIDSEDKAYWLGFLLADGCIGKSAGSMRSMRVFLKRSDISHLRKLAKFLNYKGKFHEDNRDHPRVGIVFNSIRLCSALVDKGWIAYKRRGDCRIIRSVPDGLFNHFFRGYFDGDGCMSYGRRASVDGGRRPNKDWYINIVCKYEDPLTLFGQKLWGVWGDIKTPHKHGSVYSLTYNGNTKLCNIINWMYEDATIFLDRKMHRKLEFDDNELYHFNTIWDFKFFARTDAIASRKDVEDIIDDFADLLIDAGWSTPDIDTHDDYEKCKNVDIGKYIADGAIKNGLAPGNRIIEVYQPRIWHISQNKAPAIADFGGYRSTLRRAVKSFLTASGNKRIYPRRLIREMVFAGFSRASMISIPVLMAAIKIFGLDGKWYDPCAGWGHRLLTAHLLGYQYEGTDPGVSYDGLLRLRKDFSIDAELHNSRWQDTKPSGYGFVLTSPPFWNKEDYLDGVDYGSFDTWYIEFIVGMYKQMHGRFVLHVDKSIKDKLICDFRTRVVELYSVGRSKSPSEFFVEVLRS